jgi:hypothetical protein
MQLFRQRNAPSHAALPSHVACSAAGPSQLSMRHSGQEPPPGMGPGISQYVAEHVVQVAVQHESKALFAAANAGPKLSMQHVAHADFMGPHAPS